MNYKIKGFIFISLIFSVFSLHAAPQAELWDYWDSHNPESKQSVSHQKFQLFLDNYLKTDNSSGINTLSYESVIEADHKNLASYIEDLERITVTSLNRDEQMAYWINLYNARTILLILDKYPVKSILDIKDNVFAFGPWDMKLLEIEGKLLSLNHIEHNILRPIWQDKRIHYVVNCASMGCPNLQARVFRAENLEEQLEAAVYDYVNHPRGVRFKGKKLIISSIYDWYKVDFGSTRESILSHLSDYAEPDLKKRLELYESNLSYDYSWNLNKTP